MSPKCSLLAALSVSLTLGLTAFACPGEQSSDESNADFYANHVSQAGYRPEGWGWKPGSTVELSVWSEPEGPGSASTQWKKVLDVTVDPNSMFGFSSGALFYPVSRSICGNPQNGQMVTIMAKSLATGKIRIRQFPADIYFTFQPCQWRIGGDRPRSQDRGKVFRHLRTSPTS